MFLIFDIVFLQVVFELHTVSLTNNSCWYANTTAGFQLKTVGNLMYYSHHISHQGLNNNLQ